MRTTEEIQEEIKKLKDLEPRIRPFSVFGTDNRAKIRAEIRVLEEDMGEDEIFDLEDLVPEETLQSMLNARDWLDGKGDDIYGSLSEGWEALAKPA